MQRLSNTPVTKFRSAALLAASAALLVGCSNTADAPSTAESGEAPRRVDYRLPARSVPVETRHVALVPSGGAHRPALLLLLHGRGSNPTSWIKDPMPSTLASLGKDAPVVVAVDGGDASFYHDRSSGNWGSYVVDEVIPDAVERFDVDASCVGIAGFSMGGFGAIDIALDHPDRFQLVGMHDAAIWTSSSATPVGAFDDGEDFARHDVIRKARSRGASLRDLTIRSDRGAESPFTPGIDELIATLRANDVAVATSTWTGPHSIRSVRPRLAQIMSDYAAALDC
jgi:S-formylglutathione hydrolase FrmB